MKKLLIALFASVLVFTGCGGHGQYYKECRPEVQEIAADACEALQMHIDGKMEDDEAERKLELMYEELDEMDDLNMYEDNVKMYVQFAGGDVALGETGIDQLHNLEDYL